MSSWLLGINDDNKWCIEDANSYRTIADDIEQKQDARLISVAPEMYEELCEALDFFKKEAFYSDEAKTYVKSIEELLARIDGESHE